MIHAFELPPVAHVCGCCVGGGSCGNCGGNWWDEEGVVELKAGGVGFINLNRLPHEGRVLGRLGIDRNDSLYKGLDIRELVAA